MKLKITLDDEEVLDEQEIHGRWTHQSLHFEAFHQSLKPVIEQINEPKPNYHNQDFFFARDSVLFWFNTSLKVIIQ